MLVHDLKHQPRYFDASCEADLSKVPANTIALSLENNPFVTDAHLAHIAGLYQLRVIDLDGTKVTDGCIETLLLLESLEEIWLEDTGVTDAGAARLSGAKNLRFVSLAYTNVSDAVIDSLLECGIEVVT